MATAAARGAGCAAELVITAIQTRKLGPIPPGNAVSLLLSSINDSDYELEMDGLTQEVLLRFMPMQGRYALSYPLHSSQEILLTTDQEIRLRLFVYDTHDLRMELLSYGPEVEVLAPVACATGYGPGIGRQPVANAALETDQSVRTISLGGRHAELVEASLPLRCLNMSGRDASTSGRQMQHDRFYRRKRTFRLIVLTLLVYWYYAETRTVASISANNRGKKRRAAATGRPSRIS